MKTLRFLLCLLAFYTFKALTAQPLNRSLHPQPINLGNKLMPTNIHGRWLIGGMAGRYMGYPVFRPYLALAGADGGLLWERYLDDIYGVELGVVNSLSEDSRGGVFYVAGSVSGCDYLIPGFLYMLDGMGETLWFKEMGQYAPIAAALPLQGVVVGERYEGLLQWYDMSGNIVTMSDFEDLYGLRLADMLSVDSNTLALMGRNQILLTEWADGEAQLRARLALSGCKSIARAPSGRLAVLAGEKAYLLDDSLNILQERDLSAYGSFGKVSCSSSGCYVAGQSPAGGHIALAMDGELNPGMTISLGPNYNFPTDMSAREEGLVVLGNALSQESGALPFSPPDPFASSKGSDIFLKSWDIAGSPSPSLRNITVENIIVGQSQITRHPEGCPPFYQEQMRAAFSGVEVVVRNTGGTTIGSLHLNTAFEPCWYICYTQQNVSLFYGGLNLAPGESAVLPFGDIQTWPLPFSNTLDLCIWASGPDGRLDDDFSDNSACFSVVVSDVEEPDEQEKSFRIFPNPASSWLEVQFLLPLAEAAELCIANALGQGLHCEALSPGQSGAHLEVGHLPAGVYLLEIRHGKSRMARLWSKR